MGKGAMVLDELFYVLLPDNSICLKKIEITIYQEWILSLDAENCICRLQNV